LLNEPPLVLFILGWYGCFLGFLNLSLRLHFWEKKVFALTEALEQGKIVKFRNGFFSQVLFRGNANGFKGLIVYVLELINQCDFMVLLIVLCMSKRGKLALGQNATVVQMLL